MPEIPEQQQHIFRSIAYMIEHKLLDIQMYLLAHRTSLRLVCIQYDSSLTEERIEKIEIALNRMYDLLETFCKEYNIKPHQTSEQKELLIKSNFLWEDITGASTKSMKGYGKIDDAILEDYNKQITSMTNAVNVLIKTCEFN